MLLIITNKNDFAADFLITKLIEKNLPYFRINSSDIPHLNITGKFSDKCESTIAIREGNSLDLSTVKSIWYRRAVSPNFSASNFSQGENNFINGELKHLIEGLLLGLDAKWINSIDSVYLGERKLYQLTIASRIGFKTPTSLVTNDANQAREFKKSQGNTIICKPIYHGLLVEQHSTSAIHTSRVNDVDLDILETTNLPSYFQNEIQRICDVRVTVIGNDIYTVEIEHDTTKTPDWREKDQTVHQKVADIPDVLKRMIIKLMEKMNLTFGAIDFIKDKNGNYIFLEINPAGEWAWLENDLGLPISDSFIKAFYGINYDQ